MSGTLDDDSHLYAQLAKVLQSRIENGTYLAGTLMPSQNDLVREFEVSRPTVIEALRVLKQKGLIETKAGRGSFVRRTHLDGLDAPQHLYDVLDRKERTSNTDLLIAGVVATPPRVAPFLFDTDGKVFLRQYVKHGPGPSEEPQELVSLWFRLSMINGTNFTSPEPLDVSVRQHLEDRTGMFLDHAMEQTDARRASEAEASALNIEMGAPVLERFTTFWRDGLEEMPFLSVSIVRIGGREPQFEKYVIKRLRHLPDLTSSPYLIA